MSKRLQVVVEVAELRRFVGAARRSGLTLSEWVRRALRRAAADAEVKDGRFKRDAIRRAVRYGEEHGSPAPPIEQMLAQVERGYLQDP